MPEKYPSADLTKARERCAQCDMQLCSLAQLKAAYDAGYRSNQWGLIDTQGREETVTSSGSSFFNKPGECNFTVSEEAKKNIIQNTPRTYSFARSYCCHTCHLDHSKAHIFHVHVKSKYFVICSSFFPYNQQKTFLSNDTNKCNCRRIVIIIRHILNDNCVKPKNVDFIFVTAGFPIFRTPELSPSLDLTVASEQCALCGMALCLLSQLKVAYDAGYRDYHWGLIDTLGRHAKVMSCDGIHNTTDTCYYFVEGGVEGYIPLSSKSETSDTAYCCITCHVYESK